MLQVDDNFAGVHDPIDVKFFDWYGEHCFTPKNVRNSRFIIMSNYVYCVWVFYLKIGRETTYILSTSSGGM